MNKVISRCPVCNHELTVARLQCDSCDTVIENHFRLSKFDYLSDEELYFTETFIRCRGNIKEVEKELHIITPEFKVWKGEQLKTIVIYTKMCRGEMTRFLLKNRITQPDELKAFEWEGFKLDTEHSTDANPLFTL